MLPPDDDSEPYRLRRKDIRRDKFQKEKENANVQSTKTSNARAKVTQERLERNWRWYEGRKEGR
jgi:hypothetical protein